MEFKTWSELPITVHCDVELPDVEVGIFNTSISIDEITLMGHDITPMFSKSEMIKFESDALEEYFDNLQAEAEGEADFRNSERKEREHSQAVTKCNAEVSARMAK